MDNLTHSLVGLAAAKAGLEKVSPGATSLCLIAASAPDADIVVLLFRDRWSFLEHHRGITHALVGTVVLALVVPLLFYAVDAAVAWLRNRGRKVNVKGLLIASAIVSATHPLLDWTNNYGVRFFLPWKPDWFYGDLVFIVDPFIWLAFGTTSFLLTSKSRKQQAVWLLIGLITTLIVLVGPRRNSLPNADLISAIWLTSIAAAIVFRLKKAGTRWGRNIATVAFLFLALYWSGLAYAHSRALTQANEQALSITKQNAEIPVKLAAMPTLANPFRWDCVVETDRAIYRYSVSLLASELNQKPSRYEKAAPGVYEAMRKISGERRVKVFLGFARFPIAQLEDPNCTSQTLVQLADLRYTEPGRSRGSFSLEIPVDCPNDRQGPDQ